MIHKSDRKSSAIDVSKQWHNLTFGTLIKRQTSTKSSIQLESETGLVEKSRISRIFRKVRFIDSKRFIDEPRLNRFHADTNTNPTARV